MPDATDTKAPEVDDIDPAAEMAAHAVSPEDADQVPVAEEKPQDVIDTIQPKSKPRTWVFKQIGKNGELIDSEEFIQRPMSFMGKMRFFGLLGEVIDKSISGEEDKAGIRLSSLFEIPGSRGQSLSASDFREADMFVQGVGKILQYAPDFLEKSYCIWLGVPDHLEDWAIDVMNQPLDEGGLSDDDGFEIIEIFIDQNWESLEDFFRNKIAELRDRIDRLRGVEEQEEEKQIEG